MMQEKTDLQYGNEVVSEQAHGSTDAGGERAVREAITMREVIARVREMGSVPTIDGNRDAGEIVRDLEMLLSRRNETRTGEDNQAQDPLSPSHGLLYFHTIKPVWLREKVKDLLTHGEDVRPLFERASSVTEVRVLLEQCEAIYDENAGECVNAQEVVDALEALIAFREKEQVVVRGELPHNELIGSALLYLQVIKPAWLREKLGVLIAIEDSARPRAEAQAEPVHPTHLFSPDFSRAHPEISLPAEGASRDVHKQTVPTERFTSVATLVNRRHDYVRASKEYEDALATSNPFTRLFSPSLRAKEKAMREALMRMSDDEDTYYQR